MDVKHIPSPEINLLLLVCTLDLSDEKKTQLTLFLQQHSINWDKLYALAAHHRVTPFLYRTLQALPTVSGEFLETLHQVCRITATDNLLKRHEYHRVANLLAEHAIEHVAFKGVYLAEHAYPESSLRSIGDLDILVEPKNLHRAIQLLESDSYHLGKKYRHYRHYSNRALLDDLHEVSLFRQFFNTSTFDVDLHWEVECLYKQFASFYLNDVMLPAAMVTENQVVLTVVHHGLINLWQRIGYVNDLYFLLVNKDIAWPWLLEKLKHYQIETIFFAGLHWCRQIWDLPVPDAVLHQMATNSQLSALVEAYEKSWTDGQARSPDAMGFIQTTFFSNAQPTFRRKLKIYAAYASHFIFRSSLIQIRTYRLYIPKELGFITAILRAIRFVYRTLTGRSSGSAVT